MKIFIAITFLAIFSPHVQGDEAELRQKIQRLNEKIDSVTELANDVQNSSRSGLVNVEERILLLGNRLDKLDDPIRHIESTKNEVNKTFAEVKALNKKLDYALDEFADIKSSQKALDGKIDVAEDAARGAQTTANSVTYIVSAVTGIVSVLVVIISLFFSSRFTNMSAEIAVSKRLLERMEQELKNVEKDKALTTETLAKLVEMLQTANS